MPLVEIYRSRRLAECEQRAFVLHAVGIPGEILPDEGDYLLCVGEERADVAATHLVRYETENAIREAPSAALTLHEHAWFAPALYVLLLMSTAYLAGIHALGRDWYEVGSLHGPSLHAGEWWRVLTALTLHADTAHLLGNLAFGIFFSYFAAQLLGPGIALASMVLAAAGGNLLDGLWMPQSHFTIGASTAVFATLGLVAAYSWRHHAPGKMRWAHRWSPLIAGISLLAFTGAGGEHTDVLAHLTGFLCGALLGAAHAHYSAALLRNAVVQLIAGGATVALMVGAWMGALMNAVH